MRYMSLSFSPKMAATAILNSEKWRTSTLGKVQKYYFNLHTKFWLDTKPIPRYCLLTTIQDDSLRNVVFQRYQWVTRLRRPMSVHGTWFKYFFRLLGAYTKNAGPPTKIVWWLIFGHQISWRSDLPFWKYSYFKFSFRFYLENLY